MTGLLFIYCMVYNKSKGFIIVEFLIVSCFNLLLH